MAGAGIGITPWAQRTVPLPTWNRRRQDPFRTEHLQGITDSGHIRHRIQGAHFVEMHVARRTPVGLRLRFRDQVIDPARMFPHALRQREPVDQRRDMSWEA